MNRPRFIHGTPTFADRDDNGMPYITATEECPHCKGEGSLEHEVSGGRWNSYIGTWEPDSHSEPCPTCLGRGLVEVKRCAITGLRHDNDDSGLMSWADGMDRDGVRLCRYSEATEDEANAFITRAGNVIYHASRAHAVAVDLREELDLSMPVGVHGLGWNELHWIAVTHKERVQYLRVPDRAFATVTINGYISLYANEEEE